MVKILPAYNLRWLLCRTLPLSLVTEHALDFSRWRIFDFSAKAWTVSATFVSLDVVVARWLSIDWLDQFSFDDLLFFTLLFRIKFRDHVWWIQA